MAAGAIAALAATTLACGWYGAVSHSARIFGPAERRGPGNRRVVSLTFDDGPSAGSIRLADYLQREGVRATFFQCGANVARHGVIAQELYRAGHELGNHSYSHRRLCPRVGWKLNLLSKATILDEFARTQEIITRETDAVPCLMRPPYGLRWRGLGMVSRQLRLTTVLWSVIGHDWEWPAERVADHVLARVRPGGIICLHDGRDTRVNPDVSETLRAVKRIIPRLKDLGYAFETTSDLLRG